MIDVKSQRPCGEAQTGALLESLGLRDLATTLGAGFFRFEKESFVEKRLSHSGIDCAKVA
jgi:hypothetical protein